MKKINVLVCDDDGSRASSWGQGAARAIGEGVHVDVATGVDLADLVGALYVFEQQVRGSRVTLNEQETAMLSKASSADVIILDSDLSPSPQDLELVDDSERTRVSQILRNGYGDAIARQLRSYTQAGMIVVVNMFWSRHSRQRIFDLTMTQDSATFADLHISASEVNDPGFWRRSDAVSGEYCPWARPSALDALETVRRSEEAITDLSQPVLSTLGIDPSNLLRSQRDLFEDHDPDGVTFDDLCSTRLGFRYKAAGETELAQHSADSRTRMAASVTRRWLQRVVVPPQNVLADAPHLFARFWPLLGADAVEVEAWNMLPSLSWSSAKEHLASPALHLQAQAFTDRPLFEVERARLLAGKAESSVKTSDLPEIVFSEDTSCFIAEDEAEPFSSDIQGPNGRRFVAKLKEVGYEPAPRLLV